MHQTCLIRPARGRSSPTTTTNTLSLHHTTFCLTVIISLIFLLLSIATHTVNGNYFMSRIHRRYFVAGNFSRVTQNDGTVLTANHLASWDGKSWRAYDGGTNGPITALFVDSCFNVYVAGQFTTAGGIETGPIAVWHTYNHKWSSLGVMNSTGKYTTDEIKTISVRCFDIPTDTARCKCQVYVGGQFEFYLNNRTDTVATNVAMFETKDKRWSNLGGVHIHGIHSSVNSVDFRDFALTVVSRYGWFGGDGFLKRYMYDNGAHTWTTIESIKPGDTISEVYYDPNYYSYAVVLVSGQFTVNTTANEEDDYGGDSNGTCSNFCQFDSMDDVWYSTNLNSTFVTRGYRLDDSTFVMGDIAIPGENDTVTSTQLAVHMGDDWETYGIIPGSNSTFGDDDEDQDSIQSFNILSFTACSLFDVGCNPNSMAVVAQSTEDPDHGVMKFFNYRTRTWTDMGRGFNGSGIATKIVGVNYADSAASSLLSSTSAVRSLFLIGIVTLFLHLM